MNRMIKQVGILVLNVLISRHCNYITRQLFCPLMPTVPYNILMPFYIQHNAIQAIYAVIGPFDPWFGSIACEKLYIVVL